MTDRDYIYEVDALRAPDFLRAKIGALPLGEMPKKRRSVPARWLAAAALVLAVGLGGALPHLFPDLFTGGELDPPTVTTTSTPTTTAGPAIPDAELERLMVARIPDTRGNESYELLFSARQSGKTLGALRYDTHQTGLGSGGINILFLVFDDAAKEPAAPPELALETGGQLQVWTTGEGHVMLLCPYYSDLTSGAALFDFYGGVLNRVTALPSGVAVPDEARDMLDPERGAAFWKNRNAVLRGAGLEIRRLQPDLSWALDFTVTLDPAAVTELAPAVDGVELGGLLAARFPTPAAGDDHFVLYSESQRGRTLGVLVYRTEEHGRGNLIIGVFDNATKEPVGEVYLHRGDYGEVSRWTERPLTTRLIWTNNTADADDRIGNCGAGLYTFAGGELTVDTRLPAGVAVPEGAEEMFDPVRGAAFWEDHNAQIQGTALAVYRRNPEYTTANRLYVDQWIHAFTVNLWVAPSSPAVTWDEALVEELAATVTDGGPEDQKTLLYQNQGALRTMGVLKYERKGGGAPTQTDQSMILIGVLDNATRRPVGEVCRFDGGMFADAAYFLPQEETFDSYILCTGWYHGQGRAENGTAALFRFDGNEISRATRFPGPELPPEVLGLLAPVQGGEAAGYDHRLLIAPNGLELFRRNPAFSISAGDPLVPRWLFDRYVPLDDDSPEPRAVEGVRRYLEEYYQARFGVGDSWDISADYTISACEYAPDYRDPDYPDALAYRVALRNNLSGEAGPERYFLFGQEYQLLSVHDIS
jgi:hypothetical protein